MVFGVQRLQSSACDVGIDLGSGQIGVAEQHLHGPQIRPVVEQMGGKGMA